MTTYSLGTTALVPGASTNKLYDVPDASLSGVSSGVYNATQTGGGQCTMMLNDVMLVKGPDGQIGQYSFDSERSTPANPVVVKRYG